MYFIVLVIKMERDTIDLLVRKLDEKLVQIGKLPPLAISHHPRSGYRWDSRARKIKEGVDYQSGDAAAFKEYIWLRLKAAINYLNVGEKLGKVIFSLSQAGQTAKKLNNNSGCLEISDYLQKVIILLAYRCKNQSIEFNSEYASNVAWAYANRADLSLLLRKFERTGDMLIATEAIASGAGINLRKVAPYIFAKRSYKVLHNKVITAVKPP